MELEEIQMTLKEALCELGVQDDTLSEEEKNQLDRNGFCLLPKILNTVQVKQMIDMLQYLFDKEQIGQPGYPIVCFDMQNKSDVFDICITHPRLLAGISHVLKDNFRLYGIHSWPKPPGHGNSPLHIDYGGAPTGYYIVCNSIWMLTDFNQENGCTRIVPGSHRWGISPQEKMKDPKASFPTEILLTGSAGDIVIFNSHVWHGSTLNQSSTPRWSLNSYWRLREGPLEKKSRVRGSLSIEARARLRPPALCLFQ